MRRNAFHHSRGIIHPYKTNAGLTTVRLVTAGGFYSSGTQISLDGSTWQAQSTGANGSYNGTYCPKFKTIVMTGPGGIRVYNAENLAVAPTSVSLPSGFVDGAAIAYHPPTGNLALGNFSGTTTHYSTNGGYTWTSTTVVGSGDMMAYSPDSGDLVMVTRSGNMGRSTNGGVSWTAMTGPPAGTRLGVAYAFGKWWVTNVGTTNIYWSSNNGTSWTPINLGTVSARIHYAAQANKLFTAYGVGVQHTSDGTTWTMSPLPNGATDVRSLGYSPTLNRFYAGTTNNCYISTDLITWQAMSGAAAFDHYAFAVADPLFV